MATITWVHRADDRDTDELKSGFTCWNPVWQKAAGTNAKSFIMRLLDENRGSRSCAKMMAGDEIHKVIS